jgi:hypothetical protein
MKTEIWVVLLQAKKLAEATERPGTDSFSQLSEGTDSVSTLIFEFVTPNLETLNNLLVKPPIFWYFAMKSLAN